MLFAPAEVDVSEQVPTATAAEQVWEPSETVTIPVGVPAPGAFTVTLQFTVYASPTTVREVRATRWILVVVVCALFTVCDPVVELVLKLPSPLYPALMVLAPAVVEVSEQLPAPLASVAVQVVAPSPIVTVPLGVPAPGATAATVTFTV